MGYIKEPKDIDLVVGPSVFTAATRNEIARAIAQYKKTGRKPLSVEIIGAAVVPLSVNTVKSGKAM